jgi:hypothetical protein
MVYWKPLLFLIEQNCKKTIFREYALPYCLTRGLIISLKLPYQIDQAALATLEYITWYIRVGMLCLDGPSGHSLGFLIK